MVCTKFVDSPLDALYDICACKEFHPFLVWIPEGVYRGVNGCAFYIQDTIKYAGPELYWVLDRVAIAVLGYCVVIFCRFSD